MRRDGYVYFVHARRVGLIKIGWTRGEPLIRLASLGHVSPVRLKLIGAIEGDRLVERSLHQKFKAAHHHGEWLAESDELMEYLRERFGPVRTRWFRDKEIYKYYKFTGVNGYAIKCFWCEIACDRGFYRFVLGDEEIRLCDTCARVDGKIRPSFHPRKQLSERSC